MSFRQRLKPIMFKWFFGLSIHLRIAILVAPVFVIGGYGLADLWATKNNPEPTGKLKMIPMELIGRCDLATDCQVGNEALKVSLKYKPASKSELIRIELTPNDRIRGMEMSLVRGDQEEHIVIEPLRGETVWYGEFPPSVLDPKPNKIRLAVAQFGKVSYSEFPVQF